MEFGGDFLGSNFLGDLFLEGFFGRNSLLTLLKSAKLFEYEMDFGFFQDFVSRLKKKGKFRSLEVRVQAHCTKKGQKH